MIEPPLEAQLMVDGGLFQFSINKSSIRKSAWDVRLSFVRLYLSLIRCCLVFTNPYPLLSPLAGKAPMISLAFVFAVFVTVTFVLFCFSAQS